MGGMSDLGGGGRLRSGRPVRGAPPEAGAPAERLDERAGEDRRPAIQFLIDEDVTPTLHEVAVARGYNAYHVQYLDRKGAADHVHRRRREPDAGDRKLAGLPADASARGRSPRRHLPPQRATRRADPALCSGNRIHRGGPAAAGHGERGARGRRRRPSSPVRDTLNHRLPPAGASPQHLFSVRSVLTERSERFSLASGWIP